jgi:acyl-CoA reductase-like NAD-dependent aldehyde dehydrogenase
MQTQTTIPAMPPRATLAARNPATGETFAQVPVSTPEEVLQARLELARSAPEWAARSARERARVLRQFQGLLLERLDEITAVLTRDTGKSRQDALIEVFMTVDFLNLYCHRAPGWLRPRPVPRGLYLFKRYWVEHRPYGVVAVIAPWNLPFALSLPAALGALVAGNAVLIKPSEITPATGAIIADLFGAVPELSPYVRVVHGGPQVGAALVQSQPDYIFLTGSTSTGKAVLAAAAEHLIPVACELGGKDPLIVLEDADVAAAARWAVWGAFFNTGQTCMAVERVYPVEAVYDEFVRQAVARTEELRVGYSEALESPYYLGPLTSERQLEIVERQLADAVARGARVLTGGRREGQFFEPTVLVDVDHSMLVMRDETFGPLLPIMKVRDEAEAVRAANDCALGLGASVWSRDHERARRVADRIQTGSVLINDTIAHFAVTNLPFGGVKESGFGRTHGREGVLQFTQATAYAVGRPPAPWDIATIMRQPGHYRFGSALMHAVFGTSWRQRLKALGLWLAHARGPRTAAPAKDSGHTPA